MLIAEYAPDPALVGKTIAQIATARGQSPPDTYLALIRDAEAYAKANPGVTRVEAVIGTSMAAKDVADFTAWPWASISSDGMLLGLHPRGKGAFAKVLRLYVREEKRLTLAEAVRKMTSLAADSVGIKDRGVVRAGAYADLVLFDPDTITDNATNANPEALATGVSRVWVNGAPVYEDGQPTHVFAGRFLKRAATGPIR
jgi:N-acyl-D-amino-acid deacylase